MSDATTLRLLAFLHPAWMIAALALVPLVARPLVPPDAGGWPVAITYSLVLLATAVALVAQGYKNKEMAEKIGDALKRRL